MRELQLIRAGRLAWADRPEPQLTDPGDAIVRPFIAGRCDGDTVPIHRPVSREVTSKTSVGDLPFRQTIARQWLVARVTRTEGTVSSA